MFNDKTSWFFQRALATVSFALIAILVTRTFFDTDQIYDPNGLTTRSSITVAQAQDIEDLRDTIVTLQENVKSIQTSLSELNTKYAITVHANENFAETAPQKGSRLLSAGKTRRSENSQTQHTLVEEETLEDTAYGTHQLTEDPTKRLEATFANDIASKVTADENLAEFHDTIDQLQTHQIQLSSGECRSQSCRIEFVHAAPDAANDIRSTIHENNPGWSGETLLQSSPNADGNGFVTTIIVLKSQT